MGISLLLFYMKQTLLCTLQRHVYQKNKTSPADPIQPTLETGKDEVKMPFWRGRCEYAPSHDH